MCKKVLVLTIPGKCKLGRPARRWKDCMEEVICALGADIEEVENRSAWRSKFQMVTTPSQLG